MVTMTLCVKQQKRYRRKEQGALLMPRPVLLPLAC